MSKPLAPDPSTCLPRADRLGAGRADAHRARAASQSVGRGSCRSDVKLSAADAARVAAEARKGVNVEMPPGFELKLWASDELIVDPVALEFDETGTLYATSTSRNNMPLDIREHPTWVPTVHTLKTVADLREFYTQGARARAQRAEPVAARSQPGRLATTFAISPS